MKKVVAVFVVGCLAVLAFTSCSEKGSEDDTIALFVISQNGNYKTPAAKIGRQD